MAIKDSFLLWAALLQLHDQEASTGGCYSADAQAGLLASLNEVRAGPTDGGGGGGAGELSTYVLGLYTQTHAYMFADTCI